MNPVTIKLNKKSWQRGIQMADADKGGFGLIYHALAEDGSPAVIKLVEKDPGASRELLFEKLSGTPHVIPILDFGEWEDYYVLVMPLAKKSLSKHLKDAGGKLTLDETLPILIDVAETLASLEKDVVHRDLKPGNVLFYEGHWCVADFGLARYAEASTAPDTRKHAMTPPYAAPEQWRNEHATPAADVYAFGVMMFELLQGHRPFGGPDYRKQHVDQPAPPVTGCPPPIVSLVSQCLIKAPLARPSPKNILKQLRTSQNTPSPASAKLQEANQILAAQQAEQSANASAIQSIEQQRKELAEAARQLFSPIRDALIERINNDAPQAKIVQGSIRFGNATLAINSVYSAPYGCLARSDARPPFDVIAYSAITVRQPPDHLNYQGRSHSLWYCDAQVAGEYRWFETAFMTGILTKEQIPAVTPFSLLPTDEDAAAAFYQWGGGRGIAWQPLPFDQGDEEQFIHRWMNWFADAFKGNLVYPRMLPEQNGGRYRHGA